MTSPSKAPQRGREPPRNWKLEIFNISKPLFFRLEGAINIQKQELL
jgi:hypothetical protein